MTRSSAIEKLESGIITNCADDISEVLCNLGDGTCDYIELIPLLEKVAAKDMFYYFDDNGAGGLPRPSGDPLSFKDWALKAIENIKENTNFEADSFIAKELKSLDNKTIRIALQIIIKGNQNDEKLIPILEKIAKKDRYSSYSYYGGFGTEDDYFGEMAQEAIQKIKENIANSKN